MSWLLQSFGATSRRRRRRQSQVVAILIVFVASLPTIVISDI